MNGAAWPVEQMATVLGGRVQEQRQGTYSIRWSNPELGTKIKLDLENNSIRLSIDRLEKQRPNFVASLVLTNVVGVDLEPEYRQVRISFADGLTLTLSPQCTLQLSSLL